MLSLPMVRFPCMGLHCTEGVERWSSLETGRHSPDVAEYSIHLLIDEILISVKSLEGKGHPET